MMNLSDYFVDKNVAIVGNASSLFQSEKKYGDLIDSFDTVCRFNKGFEISDKNSQGTKTTLVFNNGLLSMFPNFKIGYTTVLASNVSEETKNRCTFTLPENSKKEIRKLINNERPSCGLLSMYYISKLKTKNVALFGFDWKKSKTFYHKENMKGPHNWDAEKTYVTKVLLKKNNWKLI